MPHVQPLSHAWPSGESAIQFSIRIFLASTDGNETDCGRVLPWDPPGHVTLSWQIAPAFQPEPDEARASHVDVYFVSAYALPPERNG